MYLNDDLYLTVICGFTIADSVERTLISNINA